MTKINKSIEQQQDLKKKDKRITDAMLQYLSGRILCDLTFHFNP